MSNKSSQLSIINQSGHDLAATGYVPGPLMRVQQVMTLAINEHNQTVAYGIIQLAAELQRQTRLLAEKGGITPEQKLQLHRLMLACMTELQAVNIQLNTQLIKILTYSGKEQSNG